MKRILVFLCSILFLSLPEATTFAASSPRLVDDADLLSASEEAELLRELNEISTRQQFDVVVVTTMDTEGKSAMEYADDFYDYHGYGFGEAYDGALLLVNMSTREWWISTTGYGIEVLSDYDIEEVSEEFLPYLSVGAYYEAFSTYAQLCDEHVTQERESEIFPAGSMFGGSAVIGMIVGLISVSVMKGKMKSVRRQNTAGGYVTSGGLHLHTRTDRFLYVHRERERLPEPSKGGSSTHIGSSGRSHGGGGGRF